MGVEDGEEVGEDGFDGSDDEGAYEIEAKDIAVLVFRIDGEEEPHREEDAYEQNS